MSLVWLIYFASIVEGLKDLFKFIAVVGTIASAGLIFVNCCFMADKYIDEELKCAVARPTKKLLQLLLS